MAAAFLSLFLPSITITAALIYVEQLSKLVNSLKGVSSRLLRQSRPDLAHRYRKGVLWSPSYFASSCGGAPLEIIRQYVEQQRTPRREA